MLYSKVMYSSKLIYSYYYSKLRKYTHYSSQLLSKFDASSATCRHCLFNLVLCGHVHFAFFLYT